MNNKSIVHKLRTSLIRIWDFKSICENVNLQTCRKKREVKRVNGSKVMRVLVRTDDETKLQKNAFSRGCRRRAWGRRRRALESQFLADGLFDCLREFWATGICKDSRRRPPHVQIPEKCYLS
ncbi:hypothetical protein HanPI659440_Chr15g0577241 [Helianthus annuus]|nr:hypothetical protein HanPI659440_Chr15g0577241 [Helianthus annuus]